MKNNEIKEKSLTEIQKLFIKKELSPVEYFKDVVSWMEESKELNTINKILFETGEKEAKESEKRYLKGKPLSPIDGIPVGIKDVIDVANVPTTKGCDAYLDNIPKKDSFVVSSFRKDGAVIVAKTNTSQFAMGPMGEVALNGPCRNAHNPDYYTGGSSCGSASAVSGHILPAAIGTDTGGSIRMPASLCGVVGLKPTFSLVSNEGAMPLSTTLDTIGPLTRTVKDNAVMLNSMTRYNRNDWRCNPHNEGNDYCSQIGQKTKGGVIYDPKLFDVRVDSEMKEMLYKSIDSFKEDGTPVKSGSLKDISKYRSAHQLILCAGGHEEHAKDMVKHQSHIYPQVFDRLTSGDLTSDEYIGYERMKDSLIEILYSFMGDADVFAIPATPIPAVPIGQKTLVLDGVEEEVIKIYPRFTWICNFSGFPAIVVPMGLNKKGLPLSISLIGRPYQEATLYQYAAILESKANKLW